MYWEDVRSRLHSMREFPRIIGEEKMFRSAVLIPLVESEGRTEILFQLRSAHIRQGGEICFPGGGFDRKKDDSFRATALRETREELGLDEKKIEILGSPGTLITPMSVMVHCFIGRLKLESLKELNPSKDEVAGIFTLPLEWFATHPPSEYKVPLRAHPWTEDPETGEQTHHFPAAQLNLPERYTAPWGGSHKIWAYKSDHGIIWGITAEILQDILPLLLDS